MARARDPKRDDAKQLYIESEGTMLLKDIAERLGKSASQIRKWKSIDEWDKLLKGNVTNESNSNVTIGKERTTTRERSKERATESDELPSNENGELTDKQWLFCLYYTKYWNATKAYQKVYESTYETARAEGSRNLAKPSIREEIERMKNEIAENVMIDGRVVLQKYIDIAFADMGDYTTFGVEEEIAYDDDGFPKVDANGNPKKYSYSYVRLKDSRETDTSLITEVRQGKDGISIKLADKMKAMEFLAKHTNLLNDRELQQLKIEKERIAINKMTGETGNTQESEIAKMLRKMAGDD